jgi:hypothetical protein
MRELMMGIFIEKDEESSKKEGHASAGIFLLPHSKQVVWYNKFLNQNSLEVVLERNHNTDSRNLSIAYLVCCVTAAERIGFTTASESWLSF